MAASRDGSSHLWVKVIETLGNVAATISKAWEVLSYQSRTVYI